MSKWLNVDEARAYLGGISKKYFYSLVDRGLRVVRIGDSTRRDARGRRVALQIRTTPDWIDEFMVRHASSTLDKTAQK